MPENKLSTKQRIFYSALHLFATKGVENASMRDIADAAGINIASIYNHYISKEQLLDACYDYFLEHRGSAAQSEETYRDILQKGTKEDIINVTNEQFPVEQEDNFVFSMTILFSRIYIDPKAIEKYLEIINNYLQFLKRFFELGIEVGRFEKFDVNRVSMLFLSAKLFAAQSITIHSGAMLDMRPAQQEMMLELSNNIPFKERG